MTDQGVLQKRDQIVAGRAVLLTYTVLNDLGGDGDGLLAQFDILPQHLMAESFRIKAIVLTDMLRKCVAMTERQDFGLLAGQRLPATTSSGIAWLASSTALKGLQRACQFAQNTDSGLFLSLVESTDTHILKILNIETTWSVLLEDLFVSRICMLTQETLPKTTWPRFVKLRREKPADPSPWHKFLGGVIYWGADETQIAWPSSLLRKQRLLSNETTAKFNESLTDKHEPSADSSLAEHVEANIKQQLNEGALSPALISRNLGLSTRSMQRQLQKSGTNFKEIVRRLRKAEAKKSIANGVEPIQAVASRLGYNDVSAFSRAFKNWFGVSPTRYRASINQHEDGAPQSQRTSSDVRR